MRTPIIPYLNVEDYQNNPNDNVIFVDPGQRDLFSAVEEKSLDDNRLDPTRLIKMSSKEFYHLAGFDTSQVKRARMLEENQRNIELLNEQNAELELELPVVLNIEEIETEMPTQKTSNLQDYLEYVRFVTLHYQVLTDHYDARYRNLLFCNYQGTLSPINHE